MAIDSKVVCLASILLSNVHLLSSTCAVGNRVLVGAAKMVDAMFEELVLCVPTHLAIVTASFAIWFELVGATSQPYSAVGRISA